MQSSWFWLFATILSVHAQKGTFPDCRAGPLAPYPICDQSLPSRVRAADLVSRMNTTEKISQIVTSAAEISRLGLPKYQWWSEALHGLAYSPGVTFGGDLPFATSFAAPLNLGATFNMTLIHQIGSKIGTEARAFNNAGQAGLTLFTPMLNIFRDPRWGRGQETPGEDPFLTGEYAYAMVRGLQEGDDDRYLKIAANCKAYDAYDLEHWNGTDRLYFDALVSDQDLVETYLPPFEKCVRDAHAASIMCSYNSINGVPLCANQLLLKTIARDSYNLDGFVVSDCDAIDLIKNTHHYTKTARETVAVALHAGTDLNCGNFYLQHAQMALDKGAIVESDIDQALERLFDVLIRLGYFDPPEQQIYRQYNKNQVNTIEAQQLALESAEQSIVLLKNLDHALPLDLNRLKNKRIALIGPTSNATILMQSNYYGQAPYLLDPITGFRMVTNGSVDIQFAFGCPINGTDQSGFTEAINLARQSDLVIFFGGLNQSIEREGMDRVSITVPAIQMALLKELELVVSSPIHVVIMSGSGLDLTFVRDSSKYASLIWMGYAGQAGGLAIASVFFGKLSPAGRLPFTIYPADYVNQVSMVDMQMRPSTKNAGRTYKFYTAQAVYPFGTGLSYSNFTYQWNNDTCFYSYSIKSLTKDRPAEEQTVIVHNLRVNVTNVGPLTGDCVVLAYLIPPQGSGAPLKQLIGFHRIHLNVNETRELFFAFPIDRFLSVALDGSKWFRPGFYRIQIDEHVVHLIDFV